MKGLNDKTDVDNRRNFAAWRNEGQKYDICVNYPGIFKTKFLSKKPSEKTVCETTLKHPIGKTILFQRHAFSCANLLREKGLISKALMDEEDPSLCLYGIQSVLSLDRTSTTVQDKRTPVFEGIVFVSSLIRTWQTAILEFAPLDFLPDSKGTKTLFIIISPYIIEGGWSVSNTTVSKHVQIYKMTKFMILLQNMFTMTRGDIREKLKKILECDIVIQEDGKDVYVYKKGVIEPVHVESYGVHDLSLSIKREVESVKKVRVGGFNLQTYEFNYNTETIESPFNAMIYELPEHGAYTTYFGEFGFGYFYQWIQKYQLKNIFVVGHGKFMRNVMKAYSEFEDVKTNSYFNENVWRFKIENNTVKLSHGIKIPHNASSMTDEPLCNAIIKRGELEQKRMVLFVPPNVRSKSKQPDVRIPVIPYESLLRNPPDVPNGVRIPVIPYESLLRNPPDVPNGVRIPVIPYESLLRNPPEPVQTVPNGVRIPVIPYESLLRNPAMPESVQDPAMAKPQGPEKQLTPERLPEEMPYQPCSERSYQELIRLLQIHSRELFAFMNTPADLESIKKFILSKKDLFQNHIICATLFHTPTLKQLIDDKIALVKSYAAYAPSALGIRDMGLRWGLKKYIKRNLEPRFPGVKDISLEGFSLDNVERFLKTLFGHLKSNKLTDTLITTCLPLANHSFYYTERTEEQIIQQAEEEIKGITEPGDGSYFTFFKSKKVPKKEQPEVVHCFTLLDLLVFRSIEFTLEETEDLIDYLKIISKLINNGARFSANGKLAPLATKGIEKSDYFNIYVFGKISKHYKDLTSVETYFNSSHKYGAGTRKFKGTSSTKTSLRRPSVKRATRRALRYKGRRRSMVNRR